MPYANGLIPDSVVSVVLDSGYDENGYWEFRCTPAFAARWAFAKTIAQSRFGRTIYVRAGWNIYRPLASQKVARTNACAQGNCNGAAYPGSSSHGGEWNGRPCLAVDVDPNGLSWNQVDQAMEAAGFSARLITEAMSGIAGGERWHYIDFNAFGPIPAGMEAYAFEEDDMPTIGEIFNTPVVKGPDGNDITLANFMQYANSWIAREVWLRTLAHPIAKDAAGNPAMIAAGDFLRYEPAEHSNTRQAIAALGSVVTPDFDYEKVAEEIAARYPQLDPSAFAVAAADEADRRERERLAQ